MTWIGFGAIFYMAIFNTKGVKVVRSTIILEFHGVGLGLGGSWAWSGCLVGGDYFPRHFEWRDEAER